MADTKKYIIEKFGYMTNVVSLTERDARVIQQFLNWACIYDEYSIEAVGDYDADEWGKELGED